MPCKTLFCFEQTEIPYVSIILCVNLMYYILLITFSTWVFYLRSLFIETSSYRSLEDQSTTKHDSLGRLWVFEILIAIWYDIYRNHPSMHTFIILINNENEKIVRNYLFRRHLNLEAVYIMLIRYYLILN